MTFRARLRFREPVTYRRLAAACIALGVDPDAVLENPREALAEASPTVPQYSDFLREVLVPRRWWAPWRRHPKLEEMPVDVALHLGAYAAADFFLSTWLATRRKPSASSAGYGSWAAFRIRMARARRSFAGWRPWTTPTTGKRSTRRLAT